MERLVDDGVVAVGTYTLPDALEKLTGKLSQPVFVSFWLCVLGVVGGDMDWMGDKEGMWLL